MTAAQGKRRLSTMTESRFHALDRLKGMLKQEKMYAIDSSYIPNEFSDQMVEEYASWRYTMVDWFQKIMGTFQYQQETLEITMSILDRYVAAKPKLMKDAKGYKLAALVSLYIAAKMHELCCLTPQHVNDLSTDRHSISRIEKEELSILNAIGWRVNPPTPIAISRELFDIIPSDLIQKDEITGIFEMQMRHMLYEEIFVTEKPSMVALAGMYNALTSVHTTDKLPKYMELRILSALGLSKTPSCDEEIRRLRELLLAVSLAKMNEGDNENENAGDDEVREDVEEASIKESPSHCSSPRTIISAVS